MSNDAMNLLLTVTSAVLVALAIIIFFGEKLKGEVTEKEKPTAQAVAVEPTPAPPTPRTDDCKEKSSVKKTVRGHFVKACSDGSTPTKFYNDPDGDGLGHDKSDYRILCAPNAAEWFTAQRLGDKTPFVYGP